MDGSGMESVVKVEVFEIKPEISLVDADPLIGEKCFAVALGDGIRDAGSDDGEGLIEALDDDGDDDDDDAIQTELGDNNDRDSDVDYEVGFN